MRQLSSVMSLNLLDKQRIPVIRLILLKPRGAQWLAQVHVARHKTEYLSKAATRLQTRAGSIKPDHYSFIV